MLLAACAMAPSGANGVSLWSRDLGCAADADERARQVCQLLGEGMEWTWTGHAIISPGWRVTWETIRRAWCAAGLREDDAPALEALRRSPDFRLETGAAGLLALLRPAAQDPGTVYHPANPAYLPRAGCPEGRR